MELRNQGKLAWEGNVVQGRRIHAEVVVDIQAVGVDNQVVEVDSLAVDIAVVVVVVDQADHKELLHFVSSNSSLLEREDFIS